MNETREQAWDDLVARLRTAASDFRTAVASREDADPDARAAAERLKADVEQFERTASDLLEKLSAGFEDRRADVENAVDRDRVDRAGRQLKDSLADLMAQAATLANELAAATKLSVDQADPELKAATRALDHVVGSAAAWLRTVIDPERDQRGGLPRVGKPPLDDL